MTRKEKLQKELDEILAKEKAEQEVALLAAIKKSGVFQTFAEGTITRNLYWWDENSGKEIADGEYLTASEILGSPSFKKGEKVLLIADGDEETGKICSYRWYNTDDGLEGPSLDEDTAFVSDVKEIRKKV